jgi:hypothetical protein
MTQFEWNLTIVAIIGVIGASITYWRTHRKKP